MTDNTTQEIDLYDDQLLSRLEELRGSCEGCNKNDVAIVLITVLIEDGINTAGAIITVLKQLGFERGHIGAVITVHTAPRNGARWRKSADGVLTLID